MEPGPLEGQKLAPVGRPGRLLNSVRQHLRRWARSRTGEPNWLTTEPCIPRLAQYLDDLGAPRRRALLAGCRLEGL